jgi:hypothetical protein
MLNARHQRLIDTIPKTNELVQPGTALSVSSDEEEEEDNSTTTSTSLVLSRGQVASNEEAVIMLPSMIGKPERQAHRRTVTTSTITAWCSKV